MRSIVENIKNACSQKDIEWIKKNKSRVKVVIKSEKFEEDEIKFLWKEVALRRYLIRNQILSPDIITAIFNDIINVNRSSISLSLFKETLLNQEISDAIIQNMSSAHSLREETLMMWETIPKKMIDILGFDFFRNTIKEWDVSHIISPCISIIDNDNNHLKTLFHDIIEHHFADLELENFFSALAKQFNLSDDIVDTIYSLKYQSFYQILQILISRNHCSYSIQAKYLLMK